MFLAGRNRNIILIWSWKNSSMQHCYIHNSSQLGTIPQTIQLCEGVLNQVPYNQSCIDSLKLIQAETHYMNQKCLTVLRLICYRQYKILSLIYLATSMKPTTTYRNIYKSVHIKKLKDKGYVRPRK